MLFLLGFGLSLELATRVDQAIRYGAPITGVYSYDSGLLAYDESGVHGRPGGVYEKWRLNSLGLRGPEVSALPTEGTLRVVTLGASETFGLYESPDAEWPRQLESELRRRGTLSEVLNGALAGASPSVQLRLLRNRLVPLEPDIVIWVVHYSSFAGLTPARLAAAVSATPPGREPPSVFAGVVPRIPRRLSEAILPRLPDSARHLLEWFRRFQQSRLRSRMGDRFGSLASVSDGERASFEYFLERASRATRENGASLVVVLPPRRLDERSLLRQSLSFPYVTRSWLVEAMHEFAKIADRERLELPLGVVDLRENFGLDAADFMVDAVHFNDAGALSFASGIVPCIGTDQCPSVGALGVPGDRVKAMGMGR